MAKYDEPWKDGRPVPKVTRGEVDEMIRALYVALVYDLELEQQTDNDLAIADAMMRSPAVQDRLRTLAPAPESSYDGGDSQGTEEDDHE